MQLPQLISHIFVAFIISNKILQQISLIRIQT